MPPFTLPLDILNDLVAFLKIFLGGVQFTRQGGLPFRFRPGPQKLPDRRRKIGHAHGGSVLVGEFGHVSCILLVGSASLDLE